MNVGYFVARYLFFNRIYRKEPVPEVSERYPFPIWASHRL